MFIGFFFPNKHKEMGPQNWTLDPTPKTPSRSDLFPISFWMLSVPWTFSGPISLYRRAQLPFTDPIRASGPKYAQIGRKMDFFGPTQQKRPKNGKNGPQRGQKRPFSHFWGFFSHFSGQGQNPFFGHFRPFLTIFGPGPKCISFLRCFRYEWCVSVFALFT